MKRDLRSLNPESLHQVPILMTDRGTPASYSYMHGFGSPTFSMINANSESVCVKFRFKTQQDIQNFTGAKAGYMKREEMGLAQCDFVQFIGNRDLTRWTLYKHVMIKNRQYAISTVESRTGRPGGGWTCECRSRPGGNVPAHNVMA